MRKAAALAAISSALLNAQSSRDLRLPYAQTVSGIVVDTEGRPLADVRIDHSGSGLKAIQTDSSGHFALETSAPAIVFRRLGYESRLARTLDASDGRIVLQAATPKEFPVCSGARSSRSSAGPITLLCLPQVPGVSATKWGHDIDYTYKNYVVKTRDGRKGILQGSGAMWSFGIPLDTDVWSSVEYSEASFTFNDIQILNARGTTAQGKRWRYVGTFGESASYSGVDEHTAHLLDQVLDGVCLQRRR